MKITKLEGGEFLIKDLKDIVIFTPEDFSEEQRMFFKTARDFAINEILPRDEEIEAQNFEVHRELLKKAGELGFLGIDVPEEYGGLGLDITSSMLVNEGLALQGSFLTTFGAHTGIGTLPIVFFGNKEQKQKYLPSIAAGEVVAGYALTEPQAGSDAMNAKTKAILKGDYYILNGTKQFITNGGFGDLFIVFAKIDGEHFTGFIVEAGYEGFTRGAEEHKMGIKGSSTTQIILEDCKVPKENLLGEIGKGHKIAFCVLDVGRLKLGTGAAGGAKIVVDKAVEYAKERKQFGKTLSQFGLIKKKIAEMTTLAYVAESTGYRITGNIDVFKSELDPSSDEYPQKMIKLLERFSVEASISKVFGSETLWKVSDEGLQIFGGYGFIKDYPMERVYRDNRINRIFEGTNEINRMVIVGTILKMALKGELDLMSRGAIITEELKDPSKIPAPSDQSDLEIASVQTELAKRMTLFSMNLAAQKYMQDLKDHQEVLAAIADQVIGVYTMESAVLRASQALSKGVADAEMMAKAARIYSQQTFSEVKGIADVLIASMFDGDQRAKNLHLVSKFHRPMETDLIDLKRELAEFVLEKDGYPFGLK